MLTKYGWNETLIWFPSRCFLQGCNSDNSQVYSLFLLIAILNTSVQCVQHAVIKEKNHNVGVQTYTRYLS